VAIRRRELIAHKNPRWRRVGPVGNATCPALNLSSHEFVLVCKQFLAAVLLRVELIARQILHDLPVSIALEDIAESVAGDVCRCGIWRICC